MNVLFLKTTADGKHERTITNYSTDDLALIALYGGMRACVGDSNIALAIGQLIDDNGHVSKSERFSRFIPAQEEE